MKQKRVTAFLALAFILGVAMPVVGITIAHNVSAAEQVASTEVSSEAELLDAITNGATSITLTGNVNLTSSLIINQATALTINLNGYTLSAGAGISNAIIIMQGNVHFAGQGNINVLNTAISLEGSNNPADTNYSMVTVDRGVTITAQNVYGITANIYHSHLSDKVKVGYGIVINFNGKIIAPYGISINGNIQHSANVPIVKINNGAVIDAMTNNSEADSTPIYAAGAGNWTVGQANLTGRAAIGMKAGQMTFNGTTVVIDGVLTNPQPSGSGIRGNNSVFQIEHHAAYADGDIVITVNSGTYTSKQGDVFYEYNLPQDERAVALPADININGGVFTAAEGKAIFGSDVADPAVNIEIGGGTFKGSDTDELIAYLKNGLILNADGTVVTKRPSGSGSTVVTPTEPETPAPEEQPITKPDDNEQKVPNTGIISGQGIINAISTTLPLLAMAGLAFIWFNHHMVKVRRGERLAEEERERVAKAYIPKMKRETTIDHFTAEPMKSHNPNGPMVDMFVK